MSNKIFRKFAQTTLAGCVLSTVSILSVNAQELKVALASEPTSVDPHFHNLTPNIQVTAHIFDALVKPTPAFGLEPGLAASWKATGDKTWEFKLRPGVKFHDGSDFDAADVVYSFCRVPTVQNSPSPFTLYTRSIVAIDVVDRYTLSLTTRTAYPLLPVELSSIGMISDGKSGAPAIAFNPAGCGAGPWPTTEEFNSGKQAIGTGPYKMVQYVKGEQIRLERNASYWGKAPAWDKVTLRPISNQGARVAALLAGDVDFIESPPIQDIPRLQADARLKVVQGVTSRVIYLAMDQASDKAPGVTEDIPNPFKDKRVREAISLAIDRKVIVDRVMGGLAIPANQFLPEMMFGHNKAIPALDRNPERAKALLAEAGLPNGFELTLSTPNDRYNNDERVAQAIAQMLTRAGIKTKVQSFTSSVFFSKRNAFEFGIWLAGWGAQTGEMSSPLRALAATVNKDLGNGVSNQGRYSNPEVDALIAQATSTVDDAARRALLEQAMAKAMIDVGVIPLHYEVRPWAMRKGLSYTPRADEFTFAFDVTRD